MKLASSLALSAAALLSLIGSLPARAQFGGFGPQRDLEIVSQFDKNGDGRLNREEREAARAYLRTQPRRGMRRFAAQEAPPKPGPPLSPSQVKNYTNESLFDVKTLRTLFLRFDDADWEKEMAEFYHTDVYVPAKLTMDGKAYGEIGVGFRGNTSFSTVSEGYKRSLKISMTYADLENNLLGYRSLNLLNAAADPTFLRSVFYMYVARQYFPAPKANYVRVVINGENWGVYANVEQFNSDETKELWNATKGARWKVPGSPRSSGGLGYFGDDPAAYKRVYEIKTKDSAKSWNDLIHFSKVLSQTPADKLVKTIEPMLDVDNALRWLALDKLAINNDGYWTRSSDYDIYEDPEGKFHVIPWDANETFRETESFGFGGGGGGHIDLDPFAGSDDPEKALLNRLLAVPEYRTRYLRYMRDMAETWLSWPKVYPIIEQFQNLIAADVKTDTRKLFSTEAFKVSLLEDDFEPGYGPTAPPSVSLKTFMDRRRAFLLNYPDIRNLPK